MLRSVAALEPGEELVVLGAGGGVGSAAVQLGAVLGAAVTAVASTPEKLEAARACGAQRLINHRAGDLRQALREALPDGADVVVDPVGGDLAEPALRSLHWGGRFVTVGYASGSIPRIPLNLVLLKGIQILGFQFGEFARHRPEEMVRNDRELLDLLVEGRGGAAHRRHLRPGRRGGRTAPPGRGSGRGQGGGRGGPSGPGVTSTSMSESDPGAAPPPVTLAPRISSTPRLGGCR